MNDGPTGFQVAPITEDDMNQVKSILQRALDGIVGMSQLKADVDTLRQTVQSLQTDTDRLRTQNANLDEALTRVRQERDEAKVALAEENRQRLTAQAERDDHRERANDLGFAKSRLEDQLYVAEQARDEAQLRVMELEDTIKSHADKLDKIASIFGAPTSEAMQPAPPTPAPAPEMLPITHDPVPAEPIPEIDWSKPYYYDEKLGIYVNDPEPIPAEPDGKAIPF